MKVASSTARLRQVAVSYRRFTANRISIALGLLALLCILESSIPCHATEDEHGNVFAQIDLDKVNDEHANVVAQIDLDRVYDESTFAAEYTRTLNQLTAVMQGWELQLDLGKFLPEKEFVEYGGLVGKANPTDADKARMTALQALSEQRSVEAATIEQKKAADLTDKDRARYQDLATSKRRVDEGRQRTQLDWQADAADKMDTFKRRQLSQLREAVAGVAKEKGVTNVYDAAVLVYSPNDLTAAVLEKLVNATPKRSGGSFRAITAGTAASVDIARVYNESGGPEALADAAERLVAAAREQLRMLQGGAYLTADELKEYAALVAKTMPSDADQSRMKALKAISDQHSAELTTLQQKKDADLTAQDRSRMATLINENRQLDNTAQTVAESLQAANKIALEKVKRRQYEILRTAVAEVAKSKGFTTVFDMAALVYSTNDLTDAVLKKVAKTEAK